MPVADRLPHHHDVGNDRLAAVRGIEFESPERLTDSAESDLNFIRDAQSACVSHVFERRREIPSGKRDLAAARQNRLREECRDGSSASDLLAPLF